MVNRFGSFFYGSILGVLASGLHVQESRLAASAHNVANVLTPSFKASEVVSRETVGGGVAGQLVKTYDFLDGAVFGSSSTSLAHEIATQVDASASWRFQLRAMRSADETLRYLVDIRA